MAATLDKRYGHEANSLESAAFYLHIERFTELKCDSHFGKDRNGDDTMPVDVWVNAKWQCYSYGSAESFQLNYQASVF